MNRNDIVRRFETWLDEVLSAEDPPNGIEADILTALTTADPHRDEPADQSSDAYTLRAAMTTLAQEVKLQGRAFQTLQHTLEVQVNRLTEESGAVSREREVELERHIERRCRRHVVGALVDLRDRLTRGLDSVRAVSQDLSTRRARRWLARAVATLGDDVPGETLAALTRGYELGLERLDQALDELNTHLIRGEGEPFDPRRMNAIEKEASNLVPEGTVLEVYRTGYEWSGEVIRPAEVKVAAARAEGRTT